jgi:hypothetical protein
MSFADRQTSNLRHALGWISLVALWLSVPLFWVALDLDHDRFLGAQFSALERTMMFPGSLLAAVVCSLIAFIARRKQNR